MAASRRPRALCLLGATQPPSPLSLEQPAETPEVQSRFPTMLPHRPVLLTKITFLSFICYSGTTLTLARAEKSPRERHAHAAILMNPAMPEFRSRTSPYYSSLWSSHTPRNHSTLFRIEVKKYDDLAMALFCPNLFPNPGNDLSFQADKTWRPPV